MLNIIELAMKRREFLKLAYLLALAPTSFVWAKSDAEIFAEKIDLAFSKGLNKLPINQITTQIAKSFLGTPYKENTLEIAYPERLIINLREFDCLTFIENVLAITLCVHKNRPSFNNFVKELAFIRYRSNSEITYANRLHYFSEWLLEAEKKKIACLLSGPDSFQKKIYLLSETQKAKEKNNLKIQELQKIQVSENNLSKQTLKGFYCNSLNFANLQDGDIIGFASNITGLDFNHTAFAYQNTFIHASSLTRQIEINKLSLKEYCFKVKSNKGIIAARLI